MDADLDTLCIAIYCTADDLLPSRAANARRGRGPHLAPIRQRIESIFFTCKEILTLEAPWRPHPRRATRADRPTLSLPGRLYLAQPPARQAEPFAHGRRGLSAGNQSSSAAVWFAIRERRLSRRLVELATGSKLDNLSEM